MRESERPWNCNEQEQRARQRGRQRAGRQTHAPAGGLLPRHEGVGAERGNQPPSRQRIRVALIRVVARLRGASTGRRWAGKASLLRDAEARHLPECGGKTRGIRLLAKSVDSPR